MLSQIKALTALELKNLYGINVFRHTKDKKAKNRSIALMAVWIFVILVVVSYIGGLSFGLVYLGQEEIVCAYLFFIASLLIFFFAIFKAGSVIFGRHGYDILCALPLSQSAIVISRFVRMYVENLVMTAVVVFPGLVVYGILTKAGVGVWILALLSLLVIPGLPLIAATLIGAIVAAVSSRMKHTGLVTAALSVLVVIAIMIGTSALSGIEENITIEMLMELSAVVSGILAKIYPPALWLGNAVTESNVLLFVMYAIGSFVVLAVSIMLVSANFHKICRGLFGTTAKHNYEMQELKKTSVVIALCKREFKGYFATGAYVTNTIIGPILGVLFAGALLFIDREEIISAIPIPLNINMLVPFVFAAVSCMMTTASVSVSMEGKYWWIAKSLPLSAKEILDGKILMNLFLMLPFYVVSEILMLVALRPGVEELLLLLVAPAIIMVFSCVFGITVNLAFPVMEWDNEVTVVKQSMSALIGGIGGSLIAMISVVILLLLPESIAGFAKWIVCLVYAVLTFVLYQKNNRTDLLKIGSK